MEGHGTFRVRSPKGKLRHASPDRKSWCNPFVPLEMLPSSLYEAGGNLIFLSKRQRMGEDGRKSVLC